MCAPASGPRGRHVGQDLAIVTVDREGHREDLATPAGNQEGVGAPALVRGRPLDLAEMRPPVPPVDPWGQHEPVQLHDPPNPLAVVAGTKGPIHHRPDPAVAIGGPAIGHGVDLLEDHGIVGSLIAAWRTLSADVIPRPPAHP
jgi:hypothetical protein